VKTDIQYQTILLAGLCWSMWCISNAYL